MKEDAPRTVSLWLGYADPNTVNATYTKPQDGDVWIMTLPETKIVTYNSEKDFKHGVREMTRKGWRVANLTSYQPSRGFLRVLMFGFLFKPKPHYTVNYERMTYAPAH